ncbi:ankyrin repeat-containing domain protein [Stachybotrys elegans]|uniref:Ankyrin repeat-containing domain protein n=1 Tax=Stachybotrys elegans TaxID=80388 RepID=A0A8K0WYG5_9HYPO|nr:ankyrin repeat-containing domain protein [Stachybotrys elegans]
MTLKYFRDPERQRDARAHERQVLESQDADLATYAAYFDELAVHREEEWRLPPGWEVVAPAGTLGTDSPVFANRHTRSATTVKPPLYKGPGTAAGDGREANQYAYLPDWTRIAPFTDDHNTNEDEDEEEDSGAGHYSGLHYAVMKGDVNLARNLVLLQKEVDMESPSGFTPLQLAVLQNEVEMVKLLLAHGADLSRACPPSPEGVAMLPICVAVAQGCIKMAQVLLDAGADPDAKSDKPSSTAVNSLSALHVCQTTSDNPAMTELLARRGANINIRDNRYKVTPLAAAVGYGREASVRVLLSLGADRTSRDIEGNSVLHLAVMGGHHGILAALLEDWTSDDQAGGLPPCNLSDVNNHGQTAFDLAVQQKDDKSVELLFSRGMKELCM